MPFPLIQSLAPLRAPHALGTGRVNQPACPPLWQGANAARSEASTEDPSETGAKVGSQMAASTSQAIDAPRGDWPQAWWKQAWGQTVKERALRRSRERAHTQLLPFGKAFPIPPELDRAASLANPSPSPSVAKVSPPAILENHTNGPAQPDSLRWSWSSPCPWTPTLRTGTWDSHGASSLLLEDPQRSDSESDPRRAVPSLQGTQRSANPSLAEARPDRERIGEQALAHDRGTAPHQDGATDRCIGNQVRELVNPDRKLARPHQPGHSLPKPFDRSAHGQQGVASELRTLSDPSSPPTTHAASQHVAAPSSTRPSQHPKAILAVEQSTPFGVWVRFRCRSEESDMVLHQEQAGATDRSTSAPLASAPRLHLQGTTLRALRTNLSALRTNLCALRNAAPRTRGDSTSRNTAAARSVDRMSEPFLTGRIADFAPVARTSEGSSWEPHSQEILPTLSRSQRLAPLVKLAQAPAISPALFSVFLWNIGSGAAHSAQGRYQGGQPMAAPLPSSTNVPASTKEQRPSPLASRPSLQIPPQVVGYTLMGSLIALTFLV